MTTATNRGVVYLFTGVKFAERMAVSLFTLREHWSGPVTIYATQDASESIARAIAADLDLAVDRREEYRCRRHSAYVTKTLIPQWSPYKETVFIDGDTIVAGDISALFTAPLTITNFSGWISTGRMMSGRIRQWQGRSAYIDELVKIQLAHDWPAINTGVFGWHAKHPALAPWHAITAAGAGLHMTDELAMQLLTGDMREYAYILTNDRFNCSPMFGKHRNSGDVRIWHFHGSKHVRKAEGRAIWEPAFRRAMEANVGGIREWAGKYDESVRGIL